MNRRGTVYQDGHFAGVLEELPEGYMFRYADDYLTAQALPPISLSMPKRVEPYWSPRLHSFFEGLLTEGPAAALQCQVLHLDIEDLFGRLLATAGHDTIGSVTIRPAESS
jgi:HipA-like protein